MGQRAAAELADLGSRVFYVVGTATGRDDIRASLSQALGDGKADAGGAADDDGGFVGEIEKWVGHVDAGHCKWTRRGVHREIGTAGHMAVSVVKLRSHCVQTRPCAMSNSCQAKPISLGHWPKV